FDQIGHVEVRLEDRANQLDILLGERLLGTVQDLLQLRIVHVDDLRRAWHPAPTPVGNEADRPRPSDAARLSSRDWNGRLSARAEGEKRVRRRKEDQVRGPTGRQSGTVSVRVGLPAASRTRS